jgi:hypothetical protein
MGDTIDVKVDGPRKKEIEERELSSGVVKRTSAAWGDGFEIEVKTAIENFLDIGVRTLNKVRRLTASPPEGHPEPPER